MVSGKWFQECGRAMDTELGAEQPVLVNWLEQDELLRDLWRQKELGTFADAFKASVPRHGVVLIRVGK